MQTSVGRAAVHLCFLHWLLAGCGESVAKQTSKSQVSSIVSLHVMSTVTTGRPPASEKQFRAFVAAKGASAMERAGVTSADQLLTSSRDGKPFVVVYGKPPVGVRPDVIVYEQEGIDGRRQVGFNSGLVEEVDEAKFQELVPPSVQVK